jgi:hypothetical protein
LDLDADERRRRRPARDNPPILAATGARVATDRYADYDTSRQLLGDRLRPTEQTTDIVVPSNMTYDRYDSYAARNAQVLKRPAGYDYELNALPHLEVSNGRPSRGYFNPVLRVVAMDGRVERLDKSPRQSVPRPLTSMCARSSSDPRNSTA